MKFVKCNVPEILEKSPFDGIITLTGQEIFQHHVVGQKNVRRIFSNFLSDLLGFLTGVLIELNRKIFARQILVVLRVFINLVCLRVDKGVHRINNQARHTLRFILDCGIYDCSKKCQRFSRTRSRGNGKISALRPKP